MRDVCWTFRPMVWGLDDGKTGCSDPVEWWVGVGVSVGLVLKLPEPDLRVRPPVQRDRLNKNFWSF